jgi:hypothetical protein
VGGEEKRENRKWEQRLHIAAFINIVHMFNLVFQLKKSNKPQREHKAAMLSRSAFACHLCEHYTFNLSEPSVFHPQNGLILSVS